MTTESQARSAAVEHAEELITAYFGPTAASVRRSTVTASRWA